MGFTSEAALESVAFVFPLPKLRVIYSLFRPFLKLAI